MSEEYAETVPRRKYDSLVAKYYDLTKQFEAINTEYQALQDTFNRVVGKKLLCFLTNLLLQLPILS